jgi:eukaryotic-like serine/threonine-protein kinase
MSRVGSATPGFERSDLATEIDTGRGESYPTPGAASGADLSAASAHETSPIPKPGTRIEKYELIRELGRGGMGAVFLARDLKLGRRVAIKFLQSSQPELNARFILEARATARFQHENIIVIHEVDEYQGNPFMVLEYLQGTPLDKLLKEGRRLPPSRVVEIAVAVTRALVLAHEHNIVHRDLKPGNIFLTESGTVKVLDFGIAKLMQEHEPQAAAGSPSAVASILAGLQDEEISRSGSSGTGESPLTRQGAIVGTLPFMSPEQWGVDAVDHRTDIWAMGILLFRMAAGKHPLAPAKGTQLVITAMLEQPMPRALQVCPDMPEELASIIDRCLIKPKAQRLGSAKELLAALEALLPGRHTASVQLHETPYAGLSSFQESDASRFFGRSREIAAAVTRLRDQPLLGVVGPSGVGKSSFVRAGVVPALKQSGEPWSTLVARPGRQPVAALAQLIAPMVSKSSTTVASDLSELQAVQEHLYREPGYLGAVLRSRARRRGHRVLLFVDQFEELYTLVADERERRTFTACLASVADDATTPLRVIISIRSDFLDRVPEDEQFMADLAPGLFFLTPPNRAGLRDALIQPAEMAGYHFESRAMVEHMLDHLESTPGALPLLQFAASKLWDTRDSEQRLLTEASYRALGGIAGALASHADAVLSRLPVQAQSLARALFLRLVTPERTRAIVSMEELRELSRSSGEMQGLLDQLVQARLLVVQTGEGGGGASVEIVHESLIHSWPLLRRWLDENQDDAAFLEQLRTAARQWQAKGYAQGLLWRGEAMEEARRWHRRYRGELPELQQAYLNAVFSLGARSTRLRRIVVATVIVFLSILVAAAGVALVVIRDAQKEATSQAQAAQRAEKQVREQLEKVEAEERRRKQAELQALTEKGKADQANVQLDEANDELVRRNEALIAALQKAEKAKRRARRARKRAQGNAEEARLAEEDARRANQELHELLERERERAKRLEGQGATTVIPDVDL